MNRTDTVALLRRDAVALAGLLNMLEHLLDIDDVAVADALDDHYGFPGAAEFLLATAGLHADALQALLTTTTDSPKAETTR